MKLSVLEQAKGRLKLTERAFESMCRAGDHRVEFPIHWLDFLIQWKGTYTKVQQAAKDTPQEIQWFGAVNTERKGDPLLRYLFEARNDGEHGIEQSAVHTAPNFTFSGDFKTAYIRSNPDGSIFFGPDGQPEVLLDGEPVKEISFNPAESHLLEVVEKDGKKKVPPPTTHLGLAIKSTPHVAAELGLRWLRALVATADAMSKP